MIKVLNKNKTDFTDKYRGAEYTFPVNETVEIPEAVATHFFGWTPDGDKAAIKAATIRMGLLTPKQVIFLTNFIIEV